MAGTIGVDLAAAGFPSVPRTQSELTRRGRPARVARGRAVHRSHRSALVRKDPEHYGSLFPDADPEVPYVWPVG